MIPRFRPALDWKEIVAALTPPRQNDIERFENDFAVLMGQKHAIAFPYGRTGIVMLLEAMGFRGREIICPAYTCVVVPHAIVTSGNEPVFVDCTPGEFNMDLDRVGDAVTERTGAVIVTSLFGYPVDLDKLDALRKRYPHIRIIQDCAHSFAAEWKGRPVQREGDAAIFGLNISKIITSIFGGMVTTDDRELAIGLRRVRNHNLQNATFAKSMRRLLYLMAVYPAFWQPFYGFVNRLERSRFLDRFVRYFDEAIIDMPEDYLEALSNIEARTGCVQVGKYASIIAQRRMIAGMYDEGLQDIPGMLPPYRVPGATYSHYVPRVRDRKGLLDHALRRGVQLGQLVEYVVPSLPAYARRAKDPTTRYAQAEILSTETVNLPLTVQPVQADYVMSVVRSFRGQ